MFCSIFEYSVFHANKVLANIFVISQLDRTLLNRTFGPGFLVHIILRKMRKKTIDIKPR